MFGNTLVQKTPSRETIVATGYTILQLMITYVTSIVGLLEMYTDFIKHTFRPPVLPNEKVTDLRI